MSFWDDGNWVSYTEFAERLVGKSMILGGSQPFGSRQVFRYFGLVLWLGFHLTHKLFTFSGGSENSPVKGAVVPFCCTKIRHPDKTQDSYPG